MNEKKVCGYVSLLADYGEKTGLITGDDRIYTVNRLIEALGIDEYSPGEIPGKDIPLNEILDNILDYACGKNIIGGGITERDIFDTKLMDCLTPRPSQVISEFNKKYDESPLAATEYYYKLSGDTNYIRRDRVSKDVKWKSPTEYGELDITINLSKPEKDPKAIAAAKNAKQSGYPKCMLCAENVGYAGRLNHPARANHRIIPVTVNGSEWALQYSPYTYYNEHCIVFNTVHTPMVIDKSAFRKLFDFVEKFPHYFVGSNADLPIVGGSILSHEHFQGGHYEFAMERAGVEKEYVIKGYEDVKAGRVKWPMSVIRISSADNGRLVELADHILTKWRAYSDPDAFIFAETEGEPHNTITPIARKRGDLYELDLVLRNNITTEEHPLGVYHPHSELHHIKKENIGLIEVMGLAVLPARLKTELDELGDAILRGDDLRKNETLAKHADWADEFMKDVDKNSLDKEKITGIIKTETGKVFSKVLEHAGVYKRNDAGFAAFDRFVDSL